MKTEQIFNYINEKFGIDAERVFDKYPEFAVFRHKKNKKWFAVFMPISGAKFGLKSETISVINLKCKPDLAELLQDGVQIFPAYHMNKKHWISVNLSSDIKREKVFDLIDMSFELTS